MLWTRVNRAHPDWPTISAELPDIIGNMVQRVRTKGLPADYVAVSRAIQQAIDGYGPLEFYQIGPCLVGIEVGAAWWSPMDLICTEAFIFRYRKDGRFHDTIKGMEQLAAARGCKHLVIGTLANFRQHAYGELLKRKGYTHISQEFSKEL